MSETTQLSALALKILYGATILLSAFLLFQVQPVIGKLILPWFGGSASVWTTCLLFFQALLLAGYLYSHWLVSFVAPRAQSVTHIALLAASCLFLPIIPSAAWKPAGTEDPILTILGLLAATIGLPYFALSTTGPLLQAWFARERPGAVPYRLFALSNFGSMLGLLGYPVLIEPFWSTRLQSVVWSVAYVGFALFCAALALRARRLGALGGTDPDNGDNDDPSAGMRLLWVGLAFCPSVLLVAITSHLTQNIAPVPMLWVVPLALYLASFIFCFEHPRWYRRALFVPLLVAGLAALAYLPTLKLDALNIRVQVLIYLAALFAFCMVCHGEVYRLRPHPKFLTGFYLMIALGGAAGGALVGVIAPRFFVGDFELAMGLVVTAVLAAFALLRDRKFGVWRVPRALLALLAVGMTATLAYALGNEQMKTLNEARLTARNFYGTLRVKDSGENEEARRILLHGRITHGEQFLDAKRRRWPTTYYGATTGGGLAILNQHRAGPQRVGIIGLGAGTLASYGRKGDHYRLYEINPLVLALANAQFTYLADTKAKVEVVLGDGRLSLERDPPQAFDVLVVDAFTGDAVPAHLLVREAFALYFRHLKPDGVLAIHVSNKFLRLAPVVKLAAANFGKRAFLVSNDDDSEKGVFGSSWVLVTDNRVFLEDDNVADDLEEIEDRPGVTLWTDDYSSLYAILK